MSKEFEKIVLEKLGNLETDVKYTKQELSSVSKRLENLETDVKGTKQELTRLTKRVGCVEIEVKDLVEVVDYLNQNFTKFDFEINRKLDTLFDSDTVNKDNIISLNTKTFNHDTRISNLENKDLHLVKL